MGKTTTEAMCLSGSSVTSCDGPVTNPWDVARIAGGSSSGSAALVRFLTGPNGGNLYNFGGGSDAVWDITIYILRCRVMLMYMFICICVRARVCVRV